MQHVSTTDHSTGNGSANAAFANAPGVGLSMTALHSSWPNLIADLSFQFGSFKMNADTTPEPPRVVPNASWVQLAGNSSVGGFNIYVPAKVCAILLEISHEKLEIAKLDGTDAALVLEYVFTEKLEALEQLLGVELQFSKIADVTRSVQAELFGLELMIESESHACALEVDGDLKEILESLCSQHAQIGVKNIAPKMIVHLGPVVLPARQAYLARIGEAIDCGVNPSDIIRGVLMRSDGRYWPIHIEDEEIEIVGELSEPVSFTDENAEQIFVTFGLGEVNLDAFQRSKLQAGSRLQVERLKNNGANVYYQAKPFGQGHLSILGSNLAVNLDRIGTFSV